MPPTISLVAATAHDRAIGRENTLPWQLPEDLRHFKRLTLNHSVIMGRKTHESLGRALPQRNNIVITRNATQAFPGCHTVSSLEQALALCAADPETFIIGGAQIYAQALPLAQRLYLTEIDLDIADADAWFPSFDPAEWRETARDIRHDAALGCRYDFVVYERLTQHIPPS